MVFTPVKRIRPILASVVAALVLSSVATAEDFPRPEWEEGTTQQEMAMNHLLWSDFISDINDEVQESGNRTLVADLIGEALVVTLNYIQILDNYESDVTCDIRLASQLKFMAVSRALFLASLYHGLTATQGAPADVQHFATQGMEDEQFIMSQLSNGCLEDDSGE